MVFALKKIIQIGPKRNLKSEGDIFGPKYCFPYWRLHFGQLFFDLNKFHE